MQYPELNIGEFASRHSSNVELENHPDDEEGYLLMVDVEPKPGEDGYPVSIGARPDTVEEVAGLYENQFADFPSDELVTVYGSNEDAIQSMREHHVEARFEAPPEEIEDSYEARGWAVDIEPIISGMEESQYEEVMEEISASTLYVVNRAESHGEVGTDLHDFHRGLVREVMPRETEPVVIDVVEESESTEYVEIEGEGTGPKDDLLEETESGSQVNYDEIISGTISQSKTKIKEVEDELGTEDWKALLEAEKEGKDRTTFKPYLEERLQEERSNEDRTDKKL